MPVTNRVPLRKSKLFFREEFALAFNEFEERFDKISELGSIDMTSWVRSNSFSILVPLEPNTAYYNEMTNAIRQASPGSVFRVAERILRETL